MQGNLRTASGTIAEPIGKDRHHATRRVVSKTGQHAVTHYEVVARYKIPVLFILYLRLDEHIKFVCI